MYAPFIRLIPEDSEIETDDVDQNGIDDSYRNSDNNVEQPSTNSAPPTIIDANTRVDNDGDATADSSPNRINEQIDTNEIAGSDGLPTEQPTLIQIDNENRNKISTGSISCDVNNGGCEQTCNMVPNNNGDENVVECSCKDGFYLDAVDGTKCLGESYKINLFIRLNFFYVLVHMHT